MKLYKYCKIEHLENLVENKIYFSNAGKLNDVYEGAFTFNVSDNMKIPFYQTFYPFDYQRIINGNYTHDEIQNSIVDYNWDGFKTDLGIASFSSIKNSQLMWAHYADEQYGICLEFNSNSFPFNNAKPVNYSSRIYTIIINCEKHISLDYLDEKFIELSYQKCDEWKYEKEWRINYLSESFLNYEPIALTAIYFGCNTILPDRKRVIEATSHIEGISYYKQLLHRNGHYRIAFEEITAPEKEKILSEEFLEH